MTAADPLRDAREKAFWALWRRWRDEPQRFAAELLDAFGRLDREHPAEPVAVKRADDLPSDAELTAWIDAHPAEFAAWAAKRQRIEGGTPARRARGDAPASCPPMTSLPPAATTEQQAARPAPRRRTTTTRKDG